MKQPRKHGRRINQEMSDKERIFAKIIDGLAISQSLARGDGYHSNSYKDSYTGRHYVHFASDKTPIKGDLVLAKTGGVSEWKIGFYVESLLDGMGGAVIREIGSNRLCNYSNESFVPIYGMNKIDLLEGDQYKFYCKVLGAFRKGDEYIYRFGGIEFYEGNEVGIFVREAFGGRMIGMESVPFEIKLKWDKKTTIKKILDTMRENGYGSREFEKRGVEK